MIHIKPYTKDLQDVWNDFNKRAKNGLFMFDRNYMEYHSDRFCDSSLLFYEKETLLALLPLNYSNNVLYSHQGLSFGGFISDFSMKQYKMNACFEALQIYMRHNNIAKIVYKAIPHIYHKYPAQEDLYSLFLHNAQVCRIDCSSVIALNQKFPLSKGRKAQIKRAKREGVFITQSQDFNGFLSLLNDVLATRHGTRAVHSLFELELLASRFPTRINLWEARLCSRLIAGALVFIYDNLVHTQYLAANDVAREIGALDLLLYTIVETYSIDKQYFSFGISTTNEGRVLNQGLIAQKESFGARSVVHAFYEFSPENDGGGGVNNPYFYSQDSLIIFQTLLVKIAFYSIISKHIFIASAFTWFFSLYKLRIQSFISLLPFFSLYLFYHFYANQANISQFFRIFFIQGRA